MKKLEKYFNNKYSLKITSKIINQFEITNKRSREKLIIDTDIVKDILRIDEVRKNYMYRTFGPKDHYIYPGGFRALKDNDFKSKLSVFVSYDSMEKKDLKGISRKSVVISGVKVGKKGRFQLAIFISDYLLAVDPGITVDMIQEMEDYQVSIVRLNKNTSEEVKLLLELKNI